MINPMDVSGKIVLVTGASSGIGEETAIHLSRLGARVILVARREDALQKVLQKLEGDHHKYYICDLKDISSIETLINKVVEENGKLDAIVHSAGIANMRPLQNVTHDFLHDMMLINFYSFIELSRLFAKKKNNSGDATIVGISSVRGYSGAIATTAYSSTKAAMNSAIKSMALELAPKKIRVNGVAPAMIETEIYTNYINEGVDMNAYAGQVSGIGKPLDVANMVVYLISDAGKFITGTTVIVDGGYLA